MPPVLPGNHVINTCIVSSHLMTGYWAQVPHTEHCGILSHLSVGSNSNISGLVLNLSDFGVTEH